MTPWISASTPPIRKGHFQLMTSGSLAILDSWYEDGEWQITLNGKWSRIELNPAMWEWRGLNFDSMSSTQNKKGPRRRPELILQLLGNDESSIECIERFARRVAMDSRFPLAKKKTSKLYIARAVLCAEKLEDKDIKRITQQASVIYECEIKPARSS